jgi:hypothetical protein
MNYSVLPPEINSQLINSGPGSAPMWEAAQAWRALAGQLSSAASSFHSVTSNLVGSSWQGASAQAMATAAAPYTAWLAAAAAHSELAAAQAGAVATAYEAARAATVRIESIAANRNTLVQLVRANWFGHLAPAIAATEAHYEGMWVQDVTAMAGYHAGASAAGGALASSAAAVSAAPKLNPREIMLPRRLDKASAVAAVVAPPQAKVASRSVSLLAARRLEKSEVRSAMAVPPQAKVASRVIPALRMEKAELRSAAAVPIAPPPLVKAPHVVPVRPLEKLEAAFLPTAHAAPAAAAPAGVQLESPEPKVAARLPYIRTEGVKQIAVKSE